MPQWIDLSSHNASLRVEQHADGERNLVLLLNEPAASEALSELGFWRDDRGLLVRAGKKVSLGEMRKHFPQAAARDMLVDEIVFAYAAQPSIDESAPIGDPVTPSFVRKAVFESEASTVRVGAHEHVLWRGQRYPTEVSADPKRAVALVHQEAVRESMRRSAASGIETWPGPSFAVAADYPFLVYGKGAVKLRASTAADHNIARLIRDMGVAEQLMANAENVHFVVENPPYMDLVVERLPYGSIGRDALYFTHYRDMNGDRVMDAEMVFLIDGYALRLVETATMSFRGGELRGLDLGFARMFSRNLIEQGFGEGKIVYSTPAPEAQRDEPLKPLGDVGEQDHNLDAQAGTPVGLNAIGETITENALGVRERHGVSGNAVAQRVAEDRLFTATTENNAALREGDIVAGRIVEVIHPLTHQLLASRPAAGLPDDGPEGLPWEGLFFHPGTGEWCPLAGATMPDRPSRAMLIAAVNAAREPVRDTGALLDVEGFIEHVNEHAAPDDYRIPSTAEQGGIEIERTEYGLSVACADRRIPYYVALNWSIVGYLPCLHAGTYGTFLMSGPRASLEQALRWSAKELATARDEYLLGVHLDMDGSPSVAVSPELFESLLQHSQRGELSQVLGDFVADPEGRFANEAFPWELVHAGLDEGEASIRITLMGASEKARPSLVVTTHVATPAVRRPPDAEKRTLGLALRQLSLESKLREVLCTHPAYEGVEKVAHDYAMALHTANPAAPAMPGRQHWGFARALITRDHATLSERLCKPEGVNRATKAYFESFTGVRLDKSPERISDQLASWAGLSPAHIVLENRRRLAERDFHGPGRRVEALAARAGAEASPGLSSALGHQGEALTVKDAVVRALATGWSLNARGTALTKDGLRDVPLTGLERDYAEHVIRIARTSSPSLADVDEPMPSAALR